MPMEVLYDQPYLISETPTPTGFPQTIDVLIGSHQYVVNTSFEPYRRDAFRHRSIQSQRESIDLTNIPGEGTVNTEGLWRRGADDWHFGAGQPYQDRKGSEAARFSTSKGIDPWMQWQCSLLNDTTTVLPLMGNGQVIRVGRYSWVLDATTGNLLNSLDQVNWIPQASYTNPTMLATDGTYVWVSYYGAVDQITASGSYGGTFSLASTQVDGVWWVGERLMASAGPNIYNLVTGGAFPSALWTHPDPNFKFNSMAAGSSQIYMAGYSTAGSSNSVVYRSTIEATGTALTIPVQALPMEGGEYVTSLYGYLNFIFVGSNLGVRMCRTLAAYDPTGNQGDLEAGPLLPGLYPPGPVSQPVQCMVGNNRFMYFGWSNYDSVSTGIGRMDLSTFIDTQAPAFTSDLMVTGTYGTQGLVTSMDWSAINNAPIFVVQGVGVFTDSGNVLSSGTVTSGLIEYGISDDKIIWAGDIGTLQPQSGSVSMSLSVDGAPLTTVGTSKTGTPVQSPFAINQIRGDLSTVQMTLNSSAGQSPVMHRWVLKALPAITAGTTISAVILLYATVSARGGDVYYDAYAEYQYLYNLRTTQTLVEYQEGPFSAQCVIDELDWLPFKEHDATTQGGFIGDLIVYLKTVDIGA